MEESGECAGKSDAKGKEESGMSREEYYRQKYLSERRYSRFVEWIAKLAITLVIATVLIIAWTHGGGM